MAAVLSEVSGISTCEKQKGENAQKACVALIHMGFAVTRR